MAHRAEGGCHLPSLSEPQRAYFYRVATVSALVLSGYGLIGSGDLANISLLIGAVLGVPVAGLAAKHTSTESIE